MRPRDIQVRKNSRLFAEVCSAVLRQGHLVQFRVQGKSMRPNLLDGDVVVVAPADSQDLRRGDVALTRNPDGLLVHRVTSVDAFHGLITTRGDAGIESDPFSKRVFGKVITRQHGERCESFGMLRTRVLHPLRTFVHRAQLAVARRLHRAITFVIRIAALLFFCCAFAASAGVAVVVVFDGTSMLGPQPQQEQAAAPKSNLVLRYWQCRKRHSESNHYDVSAGKELAF